MTFKHNKRINIIIKNPTLKICVLEYLTFPVVTAHSYFIVYNVYPLHVPINSLKHNFRHFQLILVMKTWPTSHQIPFWQVKIISSQIIIYVMLSFCHLWIASYAWIWRRKIQTFLNNNIFEQHLVYINTIEITFVNFVQNKCRLKEFDFFFKIYEHVKNCIYRLVDISIFINL